MRTSKGRPLRALIVGLLVLGTSMVGEPTLAQGPVDGTESTATAVPDETVAEETTTTDTVIPEGELIEESPPTDSARSGASADPAVAINTITTISLPNPDLRASCGTDVVLVLDESGSIDTANAVTNVSAAVKSLATGLSNTGSRLRIVEFSTNARNAVINGSTALQVVDSAYLGALDVYLRNGADTNNGIHPGNASSFNPHEGDSDGEYFTNWEAGLSKALPGAPLVVFITDGEPNTIGTAGHSNGGAQNASTAATAAIEEANAMKTAAPAQHLLAVGVGNAMSSATSFNRLRDLIEPTNPIVWTGTGDLDLRTTDALKVTQFSALGDALRRVVFGLCAPSLSVTKVNDAGEAIGNFPFTATVDVENTGAGSVRQLDWVKPDLGVTAAPTTKTVATGASGTALFQWTPNTRTDPEAWNSIVTFTEVLPVGWTPGWSAADPPTCVVQRLNSDGTISDFEVALSWSPTNPVGGDTVTFSFSGKIQPADIVTCTIQNNRPAKAVVRKTSSADGSLNLAGAVFKLQINNGATFVDVPGATATTGASGTVEFGSLIVGRAYRVVEVTPPAGYSLSSPSSQEFTPTVPNGVVNLVFTNTQIPATLVIVKTTINGVGGPFTFPITPAVGSVSSIELTTAIGSNPVSATVTGLIAGTQYTVGPEQVDPGAWSAGSITCVRNGDPTPIGTTFTPNAGDTITCTITNTKRGSVTIDKTASAALAVPGIANQFDVTYAITIASSSGMPEVFSVSDAPALGVGVTYEVIGTPTSSDSVNAPVVPGWTGTGANMLLVDNGTITPLGTITYSITLRLTIAPDADPSAIACDPTAPTPGSGAYNGAVLSFNGVEYPAQACTPLHLATISVVKTDSVDEPVLRDQAFSYSIVVTNNGPSPVTNVTITDDLPDGLILLGASGANWTVLLSDPLTLQYAGALAAGASAEVITVDVKVAAAYEGQAFHNVALAQATVESDVVTANDDETTPFTTVSDLAIVKTVSDETPDAGSTFSWTLTVTNNGPDTAESVVVSDVIPDRLTLVSVTSAQFSCSNVGNAITCTKASLAKGETGTITIVVSVPADLPGQSIENVGVVSSSTTDSNPTNNTSASTVLTQVTAVAVVVPAIPEVIAPLPATGSDVVGLLTLGIAIVVGGGVLIMAGRRRRHIS